jgi:outer membrane translocation and assembly module TamA
MDTADQGSEVPFYLMQTLGGTDMLRGFRDFRFRDKNLIYLSAEYRWEAAPAVELAAFYDTGKVASERSDLGFNHLRHGFGAGIRFKTFRRVVLRIDVGHSEEGTFAHIALGPSF